MSLRRRACATVIAGVALSVCLVCASFVSAWAGEDDDPHAMLFSGRDLLLNGAFAHGGFLFAPSGLDQGGLLLKILFASGLYQYDAKNLGGERVIGAEGLAHVLAGWRIKRGDVEFKFFLDPNFKNIIFSRMILPTDCAALHSACDWRLTCGTSRHPIPWS
ncbi:MAG: cellulose biosynthesis protein BcsS, partial [Pseudolabrys sp.]